MNEEMTSSSSLVVIPKERKTDLSLSRISSFVSVDRVYVGLPSELFVLLYFFFWLLCCLFFVDIRILITPLVSSNSSSPVS
jgi:hypothetical protein